MKLRNILSISLLTLTAFASQAAESVEALLDRAVNKLSAAPAVEVQFTVTGADKPVQGSMIMAGPKFALTTPVIDVWYDGSTQWTMLKSSSEVSITEPTLEELMESNPFAILRNYSTYYQAARLRDSNGNKRVSLTPLYPADTEIAGAMVIIGPDGWVRGAEVEFKDRRIISATVDNIGSVPAKPASAFRFNPAQHRGVEVIDLR